MGISVDVICTTHIFLAALGAQSALASTPAGSRLMLGAQLAVTAEAADDGSTLVALNVLPLTVEWALAPRVGLRATTVLNLRFEGEQTALAHRGGGLTVPVFLGRDEQRPRQGFYLGPHGGFTVYPAVQGQDWTAALEAGVRWEVLPGWTLNLAGQLGASRLVRPTAEATRWVNHFGVYPGLGAWVL